MPASSRRRTTSAAPAIATTAAVLDRLAPSTGNVIRLTDDHLRTGPTVRKRGIIFADQFCGAGGWTTGFMQAATRRDVHVIDAAVINHWPIAIETHSANYPDLRHFCQDMGTLRPLVTFPNGHIDVLIASPTCTFHSRARGGRPTSDQQRLDPWYILPWLTELDVTALVVENIKEFRDWGPVDATSGKPIRSRKGQYFLAWINAIRAAGYDVDFRILNCADYGDPTTRERFFLIARKDGKPIRWPAPTHDRDRGGDLIGGKNPWRTAREIIDWNRKGECLFERKKPLAPNTLRRAMVGARRYFGPLAPLYVAALELEMRRSIAVWGDDNPADMPQSDPTPANDGAALVELRGMSTAHAITGPIPTVTSGGIHLGLIEATIPFVIGQQSCSAARPVTEPIMTVATGGVLRLAEAAVIVMNGRSAAASTDEPLDTVTTTSHLALAEAVLVTTNHGAKSETEARCQRVSDPLPAQTGSRGLALVEGTVSMSAKVIPPSVNDDANGTKAGTGESAPAFVMQTDQTSNDAGRFRSVEQPIGTLVTVRNLALGTSSVLAFDGTHAALAALAALHAARRLVLIVDPATGEARFGKLCMPFRMLHNSELARGTSFPTTYRFQGTDKDVTKQIGNAVPVETAAAILGTLIDTLDLPMVDVRLPHPQAAE